MPVTIVARNKADREVAFARVLREGGMMIYAPDLGQQIRDWILEECEKSPGAERPETGVPERSLEEKGERNG